MKIQVVVYSSFHALMRDYDYRLSVIICILTIVDIRFKTNKPSGYTLKPQKKKVQQLVNFFVKLTWKKREIIMKERKLF